MNNSTEPIRNIVKIYPDLKKLTILKYKKTRDAIITDTEKGGSIFQESNLERSIRQTKTTITDYVLSNNFEIFATFTFSPKKSIDSTSTLVNTSLENGYNASAKKMRILNTSLCQNATKTARSIFTRYSKTSIVLRSKKQKSVKKIATFSL